MEPHCRKHYLFSCIFYRENTVQYSPGRGKWVTPLYKLVWKAGSEKSTEKMYTSIWNRLRVWTEPSRTSPPPPSSKSPEGYPFSGECCICGGILLVHHQCQKLFLNGPLLLLLPCWYNSWCEIANINYIWKLQQCNPKRKVLCFLMASRKTKHSF